MSIFIQCPGCEKKLKGQDELAGKRVKCPGCGQVILVPSAESAPQPKTTKPLDLKQSEAEAQLAVKRNNNPSSPTTPSALSDPDTHASTVSTPIDAPPRLSTWSEAAGAGAIGGSVAGLIAWYGDGKLGFGAFIVFMFVTMGINGGGRKAIACIIFAIVAALVAVLLKR